MCRKFYFYSFIGYRVIQETKYCGDGDGGDGDGRRKNQKQTSSLPGMLN